MSKLTLGRMAKLYGLHRSSLYEAVDKGRVSAGFDGKGQRVVDLAEMIRVYGEPPGRPTPEPDTFRQTADISPTPVGWAEMVAELRLLREEVAGLRQEMRLIEHRPGGVLKTEETVRPQDEDAPPVGEYQPSPTEPNQAQQTREDGVKPAKPQSFADLLAGLE